MGDMAPIMATVRSIHAINIPRKQSVYIIRKKRAQKDGNCRPVIDLENVATIEIYSKSGRFGNVANASANVFTNMKLSQRYLTCTIISGEVSSRGLLLRV